MAFDPSTYSSLADQRAGKWHIAAAQDIQKRINATAELVYDFNQLRPSQQEQQAALLKQILNPHSGHCVIRQPFIVEYGINTTIGQGTFINYGTTILDTAEVTIGESVLIGPHCRIITVSHPVDDPEMRTGGWEIAQPVVIANRVWLGAGVYVLPGVTIGEDAIIGAASVVTKNIPPRAIALGNPAKVLRYQDPDKQERTQLPPDVPINAWG